METNPIKIRQVYIRDFLVNVMENTDNDYHKKRIRKVIMNFLYTRIRLSPRNYVPIPLLENHVVINLPKFARINQQKGKDTSCNWYLTRKDRAHFISYLNGIFFMCVTDFLSAKIKKGISIEDGIFEFIEKYYLNIDSVETIQKFWYRMKKS
jgi:hypothetical protein